MCKTDSLKAERVLWRSAGLWTAPLGQTSHPAPERTETRLLSSRWWNLKVNAAACSHRLPAAYCPIDPSSLPVMSGGLSTVLVASLRAYRTRSAGTSVSVWPTMQQPTVASMAWICGQDTHGSKVIASHQRLSDLQEWSSSVSPAQLTAGCWNQE